MGDAFSSPYSCRVTLLLIYNRQLTHQDYSKLNFSYIIKMNSNLLLVLLCSQVAWICVSGAEEYPSCIVCNSNEDPDCETTEGVNLHSDWKKKCDSQEFKDAHDTVMQPKGCYKTMSTLYDAVNRVDVVLTDRGCTYTHPDNKVKEGCTEAITPGSGSYTSCRCMAKDGKACNTGVQAGGH